MKGNYGIITAMKLCLFEMVLRAASYRQIKLRQAYNNVIVWSQEETQKGIVVRRGGGRFS
jgi:hypothetical protein